MLVPTIVGALGLYLYLVHLGLAGTTAGLILGHTTLTTPFVIVIANASMRQIDPNLETAARIMGAGPLLVFRRVVLPRLYPAAVAAALFAFLISFDEVVIAWFVSGVGTATLPVKMYSAIHWEVSPVLPVISTSADAAIVGRVHGRRGAARAECCGCLNRPPRTAPRWCSSTASASAMARCRRCMRRILRSPKGSSLLCSVRAVPGRRHCST